MREIRHSRLWARLGESERGQTIVAAARCLSSSRARSGAACAAPSRDATPEPVSLALVSSSSWFGDAGAGNARQAPVMLLERFSIVTW